MNKILIIKYKKVFIILLGILAALYLLLYTASAEASGLSLGIYPPILQIEAKAPAYIKALIFIENLGEETVELKTLFKPFEASGKENGEVSYLSNKETQGEDPLLFQRIKIFDAENEIKDIKLGPSQRKKLELSIDIPKDEPPSDYYFSVVFISKNETAGSKNISSTPGGIATNVLLSIGPKRKTEGSIEEFSSPLFLEKGPVPFTVRLKNESKHFITPKGFILITNMFGQTIGKVELLPVNVLSETIRVIPDSDSLEPIYPKSPSLKNQNLPKAFWRENFLLGPYTAELNVALSENGPVIKRTIRFFGFPIQALFGIIIMILVILLVKNRVKKRITKTNV